MSRISGEASYTGEGLEGIQSRVFERTRRAGVSVPSTSKRQIVSLRGRSWRGVYEGGDTRAIASAAVAWKGENRDCTVQEQGEIGELLGVEEGTRYYLPKQWNGWEKVGQGWGARLVPTRYYTEHVR